MSTTLELATGELVTLAAGELLGDGRTRLTQLQVYGRLLGRRGSQNGYIAVDVVVQLQPDEAARLALELIRRACPPTSMLRSSIEHELRRLDFAE